MLHGSNSRPFWELWSVLREKDNGDCKQREVYMSEVLSERVQT